MTKRERRAAEDLADALTAATRDAYLAAAQAVAAYGIDSREAAAANAAAWQLKGKRNAAWAAVNP
jgi:hypothetical protein